MGTRYFGEPWDCPAVRDAAAVPTPVGSPCVHCSIPIGADDSGFLVPSLDRRVIGPGPTHRECLLWVVTGGVEHLEGRCPCAAGDGPCEPEDGMSVREAGLRAWRWVRDRQKRAVSSP